MIHKINLYNLLETVCGIDPDNIETTLDWHKVTCKNCLKSKTK